VETGKDASTTTPEAPLFEPPNGMYPARVDDKGRLKLPVGFQQYFAGLAEKKLFVTSLDRRIGNIYLNSVWRKNQQFFNENRGLAAESKRIAFNAHDLGSDSEMDAQGRILLPPEMRRELGIENQSVRLFAYKGHIQILSETIYAEQRRLATASAESDLETLNGAGLI